MNGKDEHWLNRAEEILRAEIGQDELLKRRELQEKLFEVRLQAHAVLFNNYVTIAANNK